jgi:hypothetical protein
MIEPLDALSNNNRMLTPDHRVRETNPYLLLDEEGGGSDDYSSQEVRTELGLLTSPSEQRTYEDMASEGVNHNYSLGDEEDEPEVAKGPHRNGLPPSRPKTNID